jgi:hypothetical protein
MPGNSLPSDGIKDILVESSIGVFAPYATLSDWYIGIGRQIDKPNRMITIYDTSGLPPEPGMDINYPGIQIVVRSEPNGYKDGHQKARDIRDALLGRPSETRNGDIFASITMTSDVIPLGVDANERYEFALNFQLIVHQGDLSNSHRVNSGV